MMAVEESPRMRANPKRQSFEPRVPESGALPLQDLLLDAWRKEGVPISIYLANGVKLEGKIDAVDKFVICLKGAGSAMVYKHAISSIVPAGNMRIPAGA